ncbi:ABC transporter permease [Gulosibacter sp. 10]|uniref:ABC transporter permease n=1 Tax=Gulosibacter sp. 10 TaxID=1255570 RepID=UPI00097ED0ED|nr:ABC transporter permease [Gulosibacter sp. 10]SJM64317.1 ABC transporter [Gulosibacter sp. 10]
MTANSTPETTGAPRDGRRPDTLARPLGAGKGIQLIAMREILTTVRSKAFIWSMVITVVAVAAVILGQNLIGNMMQSLFTSDDETTVATTVDAEAFGELEGITFESAGSADDAVAAVESDRADVALVSGPEAVGLQLYADDGSQLDTSAFAELPFVLVGSDEVPEMLSGMLTIAPGEGFLEPEASGGDAMANYFLALAFALLYFMSIMMFSQRIAQTVIEEKASRIVELLLATVKPVTVLAGKVIGGTVMAFAEVLLIVIVALGCFAATGQQDMLSMLGSPMIWFAVLFLAGFILFAALYAALASTVSRPEDVASATSPLTVLIMIPYMLVIIANQNETLMTWLSYIPFSAPVAMPVRMFNTGTEWWEPFLALAILVVTVVVALWFAARIYQNSILRTGSKIKVVDAFRNK